MLPLALVLLGALGSAVAQVRLIERWGREGGPPLQPRPTPVHGAGYATVALALRQEPAFRAGQLPGRLVIPVHGLAAWPNS